MKSHRFLGWSIGILIGYMVFSQLPTGLSDFEVLIADVVIMTSGIWATGL